MKKKYWFGALASLSVVCVSEVASAAPRTHDGFQFRGGAGLGYLSDSESIELPAGFTGVDLGNATISGVAGAFELYFGGSVAPGLAIGGTLGVTVATGPKVKFDNGGTFNASNDASLNLVTLGPYVDYYPDATAGLHLLGTVGFASLDASNGNSSSNASTGFGLGAGVGYDWWVSDEWSLGVLGRFTYASMTYSSGGATRKDNAIAPTVLFSFAFN